MIEQFVPYELALEIKELGYNEPCFGYQAEGQKLSIQLKITNSKLDKQAQKYRNTYKGILPIMIAKPTYQQAFRWFREKHKLVGLIEIGTQEYSFIIFDEFTDSRKITSSMNGTYEEAELECLKKLIEIVKNKLNS